MLTAQPSTTLVSLRPILSRNNGSAIVPTIAALASKTLNRLWPHLQELSRAGPEASEQLLTRLRSGEVFFGDEEWSEQETNPEKEETESA